MPWTTFRLQVRYGDHWAAVHPHGITPETLAAEILLEKGETLAQAAVYSGWTIGQMELRTNIHTFPAFGDLQGPDINTHISLKDTLYFSGSGYQYRGLRVTQLLAHRTICG